METKELIINRVMYAKYEIDLDRKILFFKKEKNIVKNNNVQSEALLLEIIQRIEKLSFYMVAYLNI